MSTTLEKVSSDLVLAVEKDPFNDDRRLGLAEYLFQHGDPRAQLIRQQCALDPDEDLIKVLLAEHGRAWAAQDLGIPLNAIPDGASVEFHKGLAWWPLQASYADFQAAVNAGRYSYTNPDITVERFHLEDAPVEINEKAVLYAPNRRIASPRAVWEMRRRLGLHVNTDQVLELCAFGEKYPDVQRKLPVVALGSVYVRLRGDRDVPSLDLWLARRRLNLDDWDGEWSPGYRFLAARK